MVCHQYVALFSWSQLYINTDMHTFIHEYVHTYMYICPECNLAESEEQVILPRYRCLLCLPGVTHDMIVLFVEKKKKGNIGKR